MALQPCPSCSRHVRSTETACPFCATALALTASPAPMTSERLGRAALFVFGAAMATNVAACSMSTTPPSDTGPNPDVSDFPPADAGTDAPTPVPDSGFFPPYGTPAPDAGNDTGGLAGAYGGPPQDGGP